VICKQVKVFLTMFLTVSLMVREFAVLLVEHQSCQHRRAAG